MATSEMKLTVSELSNIPGNPWLAHFFEDPCPIFFNGVAGRLLMCTLLLLLLRETLDLHLNYYLKCQHDFPPDISQAGLTIEYG